MTAREIDEETLIRLIDGDCPESEAQEILARLRTEPDLLRLYRRICEFEAAITELFPRIQGAEPSSEEKIVAPSEFSQTSPPRKNILRKGIPWIAAAACIAILAGILASIQYRAEIPEKNAVLDFSPSSLVSGGGELPGVLGQGKTIHLERGHVGLSLQNRKVRAVIEGPASFSLTDTNSLDISQGKVHFSIAPGSKPIRTTVGKYLVEDLGTMFGITADDAALKEVLVSEGSVRLSIPSDPRAPSATVPAGSGVTFQSGEMELVTNPDYSSYRKAVDHTETVFEWSADLDPQLAMFRSTTPGMMIRSGDFVEFHGKPEGTAWLDMPWEMPTKAGPDFVIHVDAALPSENGRIADGHCGFSAFAGSKERFFLGQRDGTEDRWVFSIYEKSGRRDEQRIYELNVSEPAAAFRIRYDSEQKLLLVQARTSKGWNMVLSEAIDHEPTFDRLRVVSLDSPLSLKEIKLFSQK